jgi:threonylcarbamoyladenosine tRNA methylthiotransferase MtaB
MPTALYHTFGCKLNFAETSAVASRWELKGIRRALAGEKPDLIFVNTCSVTELADKKCRQTIRSYNRRYPDAAIIVTGCYAQLKSEEAASLPGVAIVAGNDKKGEIDSFLDRFLASHEKQLEVIPAKDIRSFTPSCSRGDRTRYFLKIQDGCDCWCSYCAIPAARGRSRSGTIAQMVEQAEKVAAEGGKEIVITGVNIGDFGKRQPDLPADAPREDFLGLIKALDKVEGIERYRISSIEPDLLTDEIIDFCSKSRAFMPHFHIPLQCGSDEVLRLMRRRYDTTLFRDKIHRIKQLMPHAFIGIDLICGARGETPEEFKRSREFIESLPITRLHIFPYSERPGTRALEIPYIVEQAEKHRRVEEMTEVSNRMLREFSEQFLGDVRPVLMEHSRPGQPMAGFTDNYLKVRVANAPAELDNQIVNVRLTEIVTNPTTNEVEFLGEYQ